MALPLVHNCVTELKHWPCRLLAPQVALFIADSPSRRGILQEELPPSVISTLRNDWYLASRRNAFFVLDGAFVSLSWMSSHL